MNRTRRCFVTTIVFAAVFCFSAQFAASVEYVEILKERRFVQISEWTIVPEQNAEYGFYASARTYFPSQVHQTVTVTLPSASRHLPQKLRLLNDSRGRLVARFFGSSLSSIETEFGCGDFESSTEFRMANADSSTLQAQVKLPAGHFPKSVPTILNRGWKKGALLTGTEFTLKLAPPKDWPEGPTISRLAIFSALEQGGRSKIGPMTSFNVKGLQPNTLYDACVMWVSIVDDASRNDPTNTHPFGDANLEILSGHQVLTCFKIQTGK